MRAYLATNLIGAVAFDSDGKVIEYALFPKKPEQIVERLNTIEAGKVTDEETSIIAKLKIHNLLEVMCERPMPGIEGISIVVKPDHIGTRMLKTQYRKLAIQFKWASSQADLNAILSKIQILKTKEQLKVEKRDRILMQAVASADELDRSINALTEHLREWYGLHFPEMDRSIKSNDKYVEIVAMYGDRKEIDVKELRKAVTKSAGMPFAPHDIAIIKTLSKSIMQLAYARKELGIYIDETARDVIPNMCAIAEPILAARLVLLAGGLEKISRLPSSTVQLLGAEKALFRHLKGEGKSPKYGALFAHSAVQNAPQEKRGKVARLIAAKLSIASRVDYFSKVDKTEELKKDFQKSLKAI
ncbi:MAG: hypothetical protein KKA90_04245 [Nanoarchaeota archaeon]|nr:hypothetical protein [Nanoarchaeota archaeon]